MSTEVHIEQKSDEPKPEAEVKTTTEKTFTTDDKPGSPEIKTVETETHKETVGK